MLGGRSSCAFWVAQPNEKAIRRILGTRTARIIAALRFAGYNVPVSRKELSVGKPKVAEKRPAVLELEPGTYHWCACGESSNQPYCDGSHAGTEFAPMKVEITEKKRVALCQCKATGNPPMCDGTHSSL